VEKTVREISSQIRDGKISPVKLVSETLEKIEKMNKELNCFITVLNEVAIQEAERAEKEISEGRYKGKLHGIPVAVKDIIYIRGVKCTAGSKILSNNIADYDSVVVKKLKEAGAIIVGTTNLHEFASGVTSVNPHYGPVRNPWDKRRIAGGSSGGSAAAVASTMVPLSLGTDTSGSIRIPASLCGVVGLKPTYGTVSRIGVIPLASSFDTVGPIARSSFDCWIAMTYISGHEDYDITTVDFKMEEPVIQERVFSVGIPLNMLEETDDGVLSVFGQFRKNLERIGFNVSEFQIKNIEKINRVWEIIRRAEAAAFHSEWLRQFQHMYGDDVREKLELGMKIYAVDYINSQNMRPHLRNSFLSEMNGLDFIVLPTTKTTAPEIGQREVKINGKSIEVYEALTSNTRIFNALGFPAISIPIGRSDGLPVGAQIVGKPYEDVKVLEASSLYEEKYGIFEGPII
jgi:aspartyl-tRNA(Asn)/glutamyl-tRNA(Gln) amidotransferase subunit A